MKRNTFKKSKVDVAYIVILVLVILALIVGSLFISGKEEEIEVGQLPDSSGQLSNKLIISEIVSSNSGIYVNDNNQATDYIELYNGTSKTIDLEGYGLSDKDDQVKWVFPSYLLEPNQYVVVSLSKDEGGLNANFKLSSSGGEKVILVNPSYKVIDAVETVALGKNQAMNRNSDGSWYICQYGTPGFENSLAGLEMYIDSLKAYEESSELVINEVLVRNNGNFINEDNKLAGYIELKNVSDHEVSLKDYCLSNDQYVPFKLQLEDITLAANEIYLIYTGNNDFTNNSYTGFNLTSKEGSVILSKKGKIVDQVDYSNLANGLALIRQSNGLVITSSTLSYGYENNDEGVKAFQNQFCMMKEGLVINEAMNENYSYLAQNGDRYYDWIELYNNSDNDIDLSDYYLSTNDDNLQQYNLPEVTLKAHDYLVVMASGNTNLSNNSYYHTNFKLSDNEGLYLVKDNQIVDCMFLTNIPVDYSYGYDQNGRAYFASPTPKASNGSGYSIISNTPILTSSYGIFNDVNTVSVDFSDIGNIYYTTDGSEPTVRSKKYQGEFTISSSTTLKAKTINSGQLPSQTVTYSYIINENDSLPVVSLTLDEDDFEDLNENSYEVGYEVPCYIEYYEDQQLVFSLPCSLSCFGGNSRSQIKKSYALRFKGEYGQNNLEYQLFDNRDNAVYDSLVLRTGSNDWARGIFRDILSTSIMDEYLDTQSYVASIVYINGQYYGIYNIREKVNGKFISDHYNVSEESVSIVNVDFSQKCGTENIEDLFNWVSYHDLSIDSNYQYVCSKIDIVNFADYWISEMYCVNPDVYNVRYFCSSELDDGKWKYIYYDMDHGFRFYDVNYYTTYLCNPYGMTGWIDNTYDNTLPRKLFENDDFVQLWLERLNYHLHNNLSKDNLNAKLDELIELYSKDIEKDRNYFSDTIDTIAGIYPSMAKYNSELEVMRTFIENRQDYVLSQTKSFFGLSNEQMKEIFEDLW